MSVHSSSASWSEKGARPADIIDLDKFMRGGVRPSRPESRIQQRDQFVVDAGGAGRKPPASTAPCVAASSSASSARPQPHAKRFSHDSGLSDASYTKRKHRPHRRTVIDNTITRNREPNSARTLANRGSSNSFRAFRAVCERALLDQQQQIARVAELCERLTERPRRPDPRRDRSITDSSEMSSSSRSSRDQRRKDKHRTGECKTYKIIMTKLDELNRLFAARAQATPAGVKAGSRALPPSARRAPVDPSSGSVSVSDKLVSTEPDVHGKNITSRRCEVAHRALVRGAGLRAVTNTCDLDIAPCDALPHRTRPNVVTESVVAKVREGSGASSYAPCKFDLDDPIHLYSQAKRLQGLQALPPTIRRARSVENMLGERLASKLESKLDERLVKGRRGGEPTLCALCRGYWRSLRQYLTAQIFG